MQIYNIVFYLVIFLHCMFISPNKIFQLCNGLYALAMWFAYAGPTHYRFSLGGIDKFLPLPPYLQ